MRLRNISCLLASFALAGAALAGEEIKTKMAIALVDTDGDDEVRLELDGDDLGFNLHDMQEGENRSIVDKSGRAILITREADGYRFDIDGKTIHMPSLDGEHHGAVWVSDSDVEDVDVHVMHDTSIAGAHSMDGVMILSEKPIDETTQQAIKSLLESAGHGSDVRFIDASGPDGGPHAIKVIEKKVEVIQ
jgi:hypothetical protein